MGISGLLPLLKPIQVNRHLSEYSGQTIAVDAYVWLHRGTYACAPELATGKKTNRYVDYAMHRVRLLQHYNITPYIVFDGGPLPAKKGTESDRKKKRDENLARANALAAQGKHTQARDFYVKCIDVTPQMAYQFIKALRAEAISYVVAPYEADAQMAYFERIGLVDGILTEDSDLLVFGCKNVLLKLDLPEATVISISRADFASLVPSTTGGISLLGWSDVQFRAMAILSGCDYLPSIPSVGLKTAWSLLRKHHTAENVVRALRIEGKKNVPKGYMQAFQLAEKVFLHQRVYDPLQEKLVNLTAIPDGEVWDEEREAHVGRDIEPSLAKQIAQGEACPVTLLPMEDINPTFVPRALKPIPLNNLVTDKPEGKWKGKGRMRAPEKANSTSLLTFFTPKSKVDTRPKSSSQPAMSPSTPTPVMTRPLVGQSSGKRSLVEVMDHDMISKRQKRKERDLPGSSSPHTPRHTTSKFFSGASSSRVDTRQPPRAIPDSEPAGPSGLGRLAHNKENIPCVEDEDELDGGEISMDEEPDPVTQEDGYMSPSPSFSRWDSPELPSPSRPRNRWSSPPAEDDFGADVLPSPPAAARPARRRSLVNSDETKTNDYSTLPSSGNILVHGTPTSAEKRKSVKAVAAPGPDLRNIFEDWDDKTSDIDESCEDSMESPASSSDPVTPESLTQRVVCVVDAYDEITSDIEEIEREAVATRNERIASGWWERWSCSGESSGQQSKIGTLQRRETTITAEGRHHPAQRLSSTKRTAQNQDLRTANRKSLPFQPQPKAIQRSGYIHDDVSKRPGSSGSERAAEIVENAKLRLDGYRYMAA